MSDNRAGTLEVIAIQLARLFGPLRQRLSRGAIIDLFADQGMLFPPELATDATFGAVVESSRAPLDALPDLITALLAAVEGDDFGGAIDKFIDLSDGLGSANGVLTSLANGLNEIAARGGLPGFSAAEVSAFTNGLPDRLLSWSAVTYVEEATPELAALLDLFGVLDRTEQQVGSADPKRPQYTSKLLHLDKLPRALVSPFGALRDLYGFGEPSFDGVAMFARLASLLSRAGIPVLNEPLAIPPRLDLIFAELTRKTDISPPGLALALGTHFDQQFQFVRPPLTATAIAKLVAPVGAVLTLEPDFGMSLTGPASSTANGELSFQVQVEQVDSPVVLFGRAEETRFEVSSVTAGLGVTLPFNANTASAQGSFQASASFKGVHLFIAPPSGDGFLSSIVPDKGVDAKFDLGLALTPNGFTLTGSGGLELDLPLHLDLGIATVDGVRLGIQLSTNGKVDIPVGATIHGHLGPVEAVVQGLGAKATFEFPGSGGNLGPVDASIDFLPPTGIGISVDAGPVRGGGFLAFGDHRYSGAIELSVYSIAIKAFGLIETVLPDGSPGFSFVIVISAEFTPIQLGFGFTLLGVGGLLGINRSLNAEGLQAAVRAGSLDNLLFPTNLVQNAPAIINDLATIFPAAPEHYVFGPMAKLGWGTPTLIDAELGIVLELPGPRLALLGVVNMALPTKDAPLLSIHLAVAGLLDFPKKLLAIDASLYDSQVVGFPIRGDMAFRLGFGDEPNFALSVGGLHPSYQPPPGFPELARVAIDLGLNGNPSLTASGYFALTSNTAQVGSALDLYASGAGIKLTGHLGYDALFVFSPFSFEASFSAGVRVSFHGVGLGIGLHGTISGPTPWHVSARACVSVLFWDACLPIDISFGTNKRAELPPMDPWEGTGDASNGVEGLKTAVERPENWSGSFPKGAHPVVTLTEQATLAATPIDPIGQATLHQKVLPLNFELTKFGIYKPINHTRFNVTSIAVGTATLSPPPAIPDKFAPALFKDMSDAEKIASQPYQKLDAGFTIDPDNVVFGDVPSHPITYDTEVIDDRRNSSLFLSSYALTERHVTAMAARGAAALGGIRQSGAQRFIDPTLAPKLSFVEDELYVVADACSALASGSFTEGIAVAQTTAQNALDKHLVEQPGDRGRYQVIPSYLAA